MVSPTSSHNDASSRILASLASMNHLQQQQHHHRSPSMIPTVSPSSYGLDDVYKMEEVANASRMVAQMALAQIRIAREQQALALSRYPYLLNTIMEQQRKGRNSVLTNSGLDALGAAAMIQQKNVTQNIPAGYIGSSSSSCGSSLERKASISLESTDSASNYENLESSYDENEESYTKTYVDDINAEDILCGRGGRSNHHSGNKRYRLVVAKMKYMYQKCEAKTMKTDLSRAIVKHCSSYGARFLKLDESNGRYYILSRGEARKKTSQALREAKLLKWVN